MNKQKFFQGLRDGIPLGLGYFAVSFSVGISCHAASLTCSITPPPENTAASL